jgi:amidase
MRRSRPSVLAAAVAALATAALVAPAGAAAAPPDTPAATGTLPAQAFTWEEATTASVHRALTTRRLTCQQLVQGYLDRIEAYDTQGPALRTMIAINPDALDDAAELDRLRRGPRTPGAGRMHCVPVLVKDNVDVAGIPTTAGSAAMSDVVPPDDAFIVEQLRDEGAIVLGKANMDKFAFGFAGFSTVAGQTRNAYEPAFGPGGSSSGSAAAIGANLGLVAIGTDTGGSLRVPATVNGVVSIRPSMRLLSQDGIVPLALFQDTAGPMCRAVEDCALMLETMAGYDGSALSGQYTLPQQRDDTGVLIGSASDFRSIVGTSERAYTRALDPDGLDGARIGVVRALFGNDPDVNAVLDQALEQMELAGATVEDVTIPNLTQITSYVSLSNYEFYDHLTLYLRSWPLEDGDTRPFHFEDVAARVTERVGTFNQRRNLGQDRFGNATYLVNTEERPGYVRPRLRAALDNVDLDGQTLGEPYDALLYPSVLSLPRPGSPNAGTNNRLSPYSGFPAMTMPAGFTEPTDDRVALPVGVEFLGREFDEATLIRLAYGYQATVAGTPLARQAPRTTPELAPPTPTRPTPRS